MLIWSLLFYYVVAAFSIGVLAVTITVENNCAWKLWPAMLSGGGEKLSNTGFELAAGSSLPLEVPATWKSGRIWARTQCEGATCYTGDCGSGPRGCDGRGGAPPVTQAEFNLRRAGGQDYYDVSLVNGFNVPMSITPQGGSGAKCLPTNCAKNVNAVCPPELSVRTKDGIVGCRSACVALNQPQHCCSGNFNSPLACKPTNYSMIFKEQCPQAYSYAFDDVSTNFVCFGGPNYLVTFCP